MFFCLFQFKLLLLPDDGFCLYYLTLHQYTNTLHYTFPTLSYTFLQYDSDSSLPSSTLRQRHADTQTNLRQQKPFPLSTDSKPSLFFLVDLKSSALVAVSRIAVPSEPLVRGELDGEEGEREGWRGCT